MKIMVRPAIILKHWGLKRNLHEEHDEISLQNPLEGRCEIAGKKGTCFIP
jgi:hypothetical protein